MAEIVLFGGTTEGRETAQALQKAGVCTLVCVATEYGEALLGASNMRRVHTGRLDADGIAALLSAERPRLVLDATHPYAMAASGNIRTACDARGVRYLRVTRAIGQESDDCRAFPDMETLLPWLNEGDGVIFSTLGAKEAAALTRVFAYRERIWLRILPSVESLSMCLAAGYPAEHIICMQGPFSAELNAAMFRAAGADILLTKATGGAGGYGEKLTAARDCGMRVAEISRPKEPDGMPLAKVIRWIEEGAL